MGGPRQVGKTTISKAIAKDAYERALYLNWDSQEDRRAIIGKKWSSDVEFVVFDELHKFSKWKSWIKGVYDTRTSDQHYLVTGSARLDIYKAGGDSLLGRYHYWRLHPFTLDELPSSMTSEEAYQRLLTVGGFPEPFLLGDERQARRWRRERFDRIIKEDVRDVEQIRDTTLLSLFIDALRSRTGGLITLSNIAGDLEISPKTAKSWLMLIEKMYLAFPIYPLTNNVPRAILKPPKVYFYDNADVTAEGGARLENLVATHLLKRLHFIEDYHGYRCELRYIRDKEGREVDFVVIIDGVIHDLIEVKTSDEKISSSLKYYSKLLKPLKTTQLVGNLKNAYEHEGIRVMHPIEYFKNPPWQEVIAI